MSAISRGRMGDEVNSRGVLSNVPCPLLPDGAAEQVPEDVPIAACVFRALEVGVGGRHSAKVSMHKSEDEGDNEGRAGVLVAGEQDGCHSR